MALVHLVRHVELHTEAHEVAHLCTGSGLEVLGNAYLSVGTNEVRQSKCSRDLGHIINDLNRC